VHIDGFEVDTGSPYNVDISLGNRRFRICLTRKRGRLHSDLRARGNGNSLVVLIGISIGDQAETGGGSDFEKCEGLGKKG
jgi:hypothetical protein